MILLSIIFVIVFLLVFITSSIIIRKRRKRALNKKNINLIDGHIFPHPDDPRWKKTNDNRFTLDNLTIYYHRYCNGKILYLVEFGCKDIDIKNISALKLYYEALQASFERRKAEQQLIIFEKIEKLSIGQ